MADWRLWGQEQYLSDVPLVKRTYKKPREDWDHDHCASCWAKFSESASDLNEGYTTKGGYYWICERCYRDFRGQFRWQVARG